MTSPTFEAAGADPTTSTTIGAVGQTMRWTVSPWGAVTPRWLDDADSLEWFVAADDRWHVPAREPSVRQHRIDGTPVTETRVRVPGGDAVQRVWAVPDHGGTALIEVENDSPLPLAVAFAGRPIVTERTPTEVPIQGIELPPDTIVLPIGHHAHVRIAVGSGRTVPASSPQGVVRGWHRVADRASRLELPDGSLAEAVIAARCDLALEGPVDPSGDPAGFVIDVSELVRCGESAAQWMPDIVEPIERIARRRRSGIDEDDHEALRAARRVATAADDRRAVGDLDRLVERLGPHAASPDEPTAASFADVRRGPSAGRFVRAIERCIVDDGRLLPGGMPAGWWGSDFEVHGVPSGPSSTISFAVRWHGERAAVLWEQAGAAVELSAPAIDPAWTSTSSAGEGLLTPRSRAARRLVPPVAVGTDVDDAGDVGDVGDVGDDAEDRASAADGGESFS